MKRKTWLKGEARRQVRAYIAERDGRHCHYCRAPFAPDLSDVTLDHYVPHCVWPMDKPRNLVLACNPCNQAKADSLPWPLVWVLLATFAQDRWELTA